MLQWVHRQERSDAGQATLEFLVIVPFVFLLLFFAVDGAKVVGSWMVIESAAREGARCGAVNPADPTGSATTTCAVNVASGLPGFQAANVLPSCPSGCQTGNPVQVRVSYTYSFAPANSLLGGFLGALRAPGLASINMSAQAQMRIEAQSS